MHVREWGACERGSGMHAGVGYIRSNYNLINYNHTSSY